MPEDTFSLYDDQATNERIIETLRLLSHKLREEDFLVIYYAGHGRLEKYTNSGYWIPVDGKPQGGNDDISSWLSNDYIKKVLKQYEAKHILLISDSCFAGDFFRGANLTGERTGTDIRTAYQRRSRRTLTSGGMEPVADSGHKGHSVFAYFLCEVLKNNRKRYFRPSDSDFFPYIKKGLTYNAKQAPRYGILKDTMSHDGEFIFFLRDDLIEE